MVKRCKHTGNWTWGETLSRKCYSLILFPEQAAIHRDKKRIANINFTRIQRCQVRDFIPKSRDSFK